MRRTLPLICLLTACSATKGLHDLGDTVDCALGCGLPNAAGVCGDNGCELAACNDGFADCNGQLSDGCEVDVDTDPLNCTICGNVCDTGVCRQGSCQDVNVVASPPDDGREVTDFVVDPSGVYFVLAPIPGAGTPATVSLEFVAGAGSEPASLAEISGVAASLAEGEERLCCLVRESTSVASPYRLLSLPKTGGEPTLLASPSVLEPYFSWLRAEQTAGLTVLELYVYWLTGGLSVAETPDSNGGLSYAWADPALHRALITGGTDETLVTWTKPDLVSLLGADSGVLLLAQEKLVEYDGGLAGVTANGLWSFDPATRAEVVVSSDTPAPYRAVLKDGIAYWVIAATSVARPSSLVSVPLSGGTPTTLWTSNTAGVNGDVAVTDRHFFLSVTSGQSPYYGLLRTVDGILRIDRAGGQETLLVKHSATPSHMLVDAEYVYWLESGQILRTLQAATPSADGG
jgi:hypothetical protein